MMKGLCSLCGKPAMQSCRYCGRIICEDCSISGVCMNCKARSKI